MVKSIFGGLLKGDVKIMTKIVMAGDDDGVVLRQIARV